jgi:hypothetical protein
VGLLRAGSATQASDLLTRAREGGAAATGPAAPEWQRPARCHRHCRTARDRAMLALFATDRRGRVVSRLVACEWSGPRAPSGRAEPVADAGAAGSFGERNRGGW